MSFFKTEFGELINIDAIAHIRPEGDSFKVSFSGANGFYITKDDYHKLVSETLAPVRGLMETMQTPVFDDHKNHVKLHNEVEKEMKKLIKPSKKVKKKVGKK